MGARWPSVQSNTLLNMPIVTTAETAIVTTPALSPAFDGGVIYLAWFFVGLLAAGVTSMTVRIRRGSGTAGTSITATAAVAATAATISQLSGCYFDTPGIVAGQQYTVTLALAGAGANTTLSDACLIAYAL